MDRQHTLPAMTLTELLVVLAILGMILLLAFPAIQPIFAKTHALEAKTNLKHLAELQKVYYLEHVKYAGEFHAIGFEQNQLATEGNGTAHYQIEIVQASNQNFLARATSVTDFDGDGQFNIWEIDKGGIPREVVID